jgi:hypothetical protein
MDHRKRNIGTYKKRGVTVSSVWPNHYTEYTPVTELLCMVQILQLPKPSYLDPSWQGFYVTLYCIIKQQRRLTTSYLCVK